MPVVARKANVGKVQINKHHGMIYNSGNSLSLVCKYWNGESFRVLSQLLGCQPDLWGGGDFELWQLAGSCAAVLVALSMMAAPLQICKWID